MGSIVSHSVIRRANSGIAKSQIIPSKHRQLKLDNFFQTTRKKWRRDEATDDETEPEIITSNTEERQCATVQWKARKVYA